MSGYNIKSSDLLLLEYKKLYMFQTFQIQIEELELSFFTLPTPGSQSPNIVRRNTGFINYDNWSHNNKS